MVPEVVEDQKLSYNPPHLVMIFDKINICQGCEIPFNKKDHRELWILIHDVPNMTKWMREKSCEQISKHCLL